MPETSKKTETTPLANEVLNRVRSCQEGLFGAATTLAAYTSAIAAGSVQGKTYGAVAGALVGSALGGPTGTVSGAIAGSVGGAALGAWLGKEIVKTTRKVIRMSARKARIIRSRTLFPKVTPEKPKPLPTRYRKSSNEKFIRDITRYVHRPQIPADLQHSRRSSSWPSDPDDED